MKATAEQIINGIVKYADNEVLNNLPTPGKWLVGTGIGIATTKASDIVNALNNNSIAKMTGIVDKEGKFDVDLVLDSMRMSANKYGKMTINVPIVGSMTFSEVDVEALKSYIERG